ncbi:Protein of unknown function [Arachidicoccus rhizosphaerae]|uniref:DUF1573 domain-containing protein n=1 Tax=Arachidicoccus rhizosphaerae TaxID=551991 RepID=A0A1H4CLQ7_9BACT|nr:DUF1573 domain-containing protein [Arachidicoccus rhizosphaerae]SEA61248.1 Protein of unknown function [Arachidicoccus rhizosphaerae]
MKRFIAILAIIIGGTCVVKAQMVKHAPPIDGFKYIKTDDTDHDFGDITYGTAVQYPIKMVNISKDSLRLTNVVVSCGCTTPEYTKGVYAPGDTIPMKVGFNGHADGNFNKTLSVLFQAPEGQFVTILRFRGKGIVKN